MPEGAGWSGASSSRSALPLWSARSAGWCSSAVEAPSYRTIQSSYAFDVTNPSYVAGYADNVSVRTVRRIAGADAEQGLTRYEGQLLLTPGTDLRPGDDRRGGR